MFVMPYLGLRRCSPPEHRDAKWLHAMTKRVVQELGFTTFAGSRWRVKKRTVLEGFSIVIVMKDVNDTFRLATGISQHEMREKPTLKVVGH